ncbi:hypothetical protein MRX96_010678 [Rhipicephalus microplus]
MLSTKGWNNSHDTEGQRPTRRRRRNRIHAANEPGTTIQNRYLHGQGHELPTWLSRSYPRAETRERDPERRKARAAALARQFQSDEKAAFVDVAKHPTRKEVFAVAVIRASTGELINAGTVRAKTPGQAEEAAMYVGQWVEFRASRRS